MTTAARQVLARMQRNPSPLYLRELVQGTGLPASDVLDGVCELEEAGLLRPATWQLTDQGKASAA